MPWLGTRVLLLCTGHCQLGGRCHLCVPRCEPNLAGCGQPPLCSILPRARAPRFCGREQDPSWTSLCWRPAQPRASRDPHQHHPGGPRLCCSTSTHHPSSWGPPTCPCPGGSFSPAGANSLPCSFSPGVSAEPAGRPGKQIHRQPPQPETSTKQGGNRSGSPPQPCPPLPWGTPEPRAPSPSHRHVSDPQARCPVAWASPPSPSLSAQHLPATGLASALILSLTPSSQATYGPPVGDTVRDGGSPPGHQLCLAPGLPCPLEVGPHVDRATGLGMVQGRMPRQCAGGVLVGSTKTSLSNCFALPREGLVSSQWASRLREATVSPASGDTQRPAHPDSVTPRASPLRTNMGQCMGRGACGARAPCGSLGLPAAHLSATHPQPLRSEGGW